MTFIFSYNNFRVRSILSKFNHKHKLSLVANDTVAFVFLSLSMCVLKDKLSLDSIYLDTLYCCL